MLALTYRNWKLFYRDRGTVFFSLLGPIIIVLLYIFFLKGTVTEELTVADGTMDYLVDSWIMAGIIASATVTTCLAGYGTMIRDREDGIARDFDTAPVAKSSVIGGYMLNSMVIGTVMSVISLVVAEIYIVANGGELLSLTQLAQVLGIILAAVFSAAGVLGLLSSFIPSQSAFSGANITVGAAIGFLVGAYIPIGSLPEGVQQVLMLIPAAQAARALREVMMAAPMAEGFDGAPAGVVSEFRTEMGVNFEFAGHSVTMFDSIAFLLVSGLVGFVLAVIVLALKRRSR
ncbi:MAG TPA: ABC transporter permease [Propionicimonas sp.]|nr:ABC transporter permease [Propionicimonas sp.]